MIEVSTTVLKQLLLAFVVVLILYIITLIVLSIDSLIVFPSFSVKQREETIIRTGNATSAQLASTRMNTIFPYKKNFVKIPQSVQGTKGTQFTYQFWLKVNETDTQYYQNLVLLLKGDDKKYKLGYYKQDGRLARTEPAKHMIKCPLIKFVDSYKHMAVEFNTNNHPDVVIDINFSANSEEDKRKNILSMLPLDWFMLTFVFEENFSIQEGTENGIKFSFYINDIPAQINSASTMPILRNNVLKQNDGDLYILPGFDSAVNVLSMSDIRYFNYAKTDLEIKADFQRRAKTLTEGASAHNLFTAI